MEPLPFVEESASALAQKIRSREATSEAIVDAHIAVLRRENPRLNAVVELRLEAAREEARRADERVRREPAERLPPLLGVPCTVKEIFAFRGMLQTAGMRSRSAHRSETDAVVVERLRDAGAIVLGTTNVSELCMWMESENRLYGRTNNPYDVTRGVGGSSGGEGAAVAAGISPFGLGSDIGGSIRIPAFMNGVFGHKPTGGLVPSEGQYPSPGPEAMRMLTTGPITRRAEDLFPLLRILAGPSSRSPEAFPIELGDPRAVSLEGLRVLDVRTNGLSRVDPALLDAQAALAEHLARRGARVVRAELPALRRSVLFWAARLANTTGPSYRELLGDGRAISLRRELPRALLGRSDFTPPSLVLALLERVPEHLPDRTRALEAELLGLRRELEERLGEGVMLFPSYTVPAPKHRHPWLRPIDWAYTAIFNALELPSTQVPLGLDRRGLPLGCQVVGPRRKDHRTIAVALEAERAFGGWTPPTRRRAARGASSFPPDRSTP